MKRKPDPKLRTQPWKVQAVFQPIEQILHRIETDGTVQVVGQQVVFEDDRAKQYYDVVAALRGVIEFHKIATSRYGIPAETDALEKLANKLRLDSPIFEGDISAARANIESCKRQALQLRVSHAESILTTVRIGTELEIAKERKAA